MRAFVSARFVLAMLGAAGAVLAVACQLGPSEARAASGRAPVVVELFSSEGCSSCPPADVALARLVRDQPVPGAEVIALEMHVDYWNDLGWPDPFSSPAFTARQQAYARSFGKRGSYTPQAVVDGTAEGIGSNDSGTRALVAAAAREPKAKIAIAIANGKATFSVSGLDASAAPGDDAELLFAITEEGLVTDVPRGENAGARLEHGPVVRALSVLGPIKPAVNEVREAPLALSPEWRREKLRVVAFLQRRSSKRIVGAAAMAL